MERSWLETVQLLGLDVMTAVALAMVLAATTPAFSAPPVSYKVDAERVRAMVSDYIDSNMPWAPG